MNSLWDFGRPIGCFRCDSLYPYDVPRQAAVAKENHGIVSLSAGHGFEDALAELAGFSHIWLLYIFHKNNTWKPKVMPPRHACRKIGLFATRSPYRPNPIGMSAVKLLKIDGLDLHVANHDLLDGTPILDIKPYLPFADSFPDATLGWTADNGAPIHVDFTEIAENQLDWLEANGVSCIRQFILTQLGYDPMNPKRHRLISTPDATSLAYRTWRVWFTFRDNNVLVQHISSGYTKDELAAIEDKYQDKDLHRRFNQLFSME